MKAISIFLFLTFFVSVVVLAGDPQTTRELTESRIDSIEKSLIKAFESDVPGLQINAALTLRQLRALAPEHSWDRCINPLMHVLNGEEHSRPARVVAAMTLYELRSARGDYAISCNARFGDDARVMHYCAILSALRLRENAKPWYAPRGASTREPEI